MKYYAYYVYVYMYMYVMKYYHNIKENLNIQTCDTFM